MTDQAPRTAAGRALLDDIAEEPDYEPRRELILAIEAEAAAPRAATEPTNRVTSDAKLGAATEPPTYPKGYDHRRGCARLHPVTHPCRTAAEEVARAATEPTHDDDVALTPGGPTSPVREAPPMRELGISRMLRPATEPGLSRETLAAALHEARCQEATVYPYEPICFEDGVYPLHLQHADAILAALRSTQEGPADG